MRIVADDPATYSPMRRDNRARIARQARVAGVPRGFG